MLYNGVMDDEFTTSPGHPGLSIGYIPSNLIGRSVVPPSIIIPQQVIVPDCSFYQETADFNVMKAAGASGVIIRAGQNLWPDPVFPTFWPGAKAAGLPRGTYFYYDSRVDPVKQAQLFYDQFKNDWPEMEIVVDFEEHYGGPWSGAANLRTFIETLLGLGVPAEKIVIYTGYYYWQDLGSTDLWFKQFRLWLAWYTSNPAYVSIPLPWDNDDLLLWQYTETGDGHAYGVGSSGIDLSYFNGSPEDFEARYGVTLPPIPPDTFKEWIFKIRPEQIVRAIVTGYSSNKTVEYAAQEFHKTIQPGNHSLVINGDGWRTSGVPNGDWVVNGLWKHIQPRDSYSPRITFASDQKKGAISGARGEYWYPEQLIDYNAFGLTRRLVKDGVINPAYQESGELNSRTTFGFKPDGTLVIQINDGWDVNTVTGEPPRGRTILETGQILIANGCIEAGDGDGGGSVTLAIDGQVINDYNDDGLKVMRAVVNHLCLELNVDPLGGIDPEPPPGESMRYQYTVVKKVGLRPYDHADAGHTPPSMYSTSIKDILPGNYETDHVPTPFGNDGVSWVDYQENGVSKGALPVFWNGVTYVTDIVDTQPPEPPTGETTYKSPAGSVPIEVRDSNGDLVETLHNRDEIVWQ